MTRADAPLAAALVAFVLAAAAMHPVSTLPPGHRAAPYIALHFVMVAAMLAAHRALRVRHSPRGLVWALAAGLVARALLVPVAPFTTTDVGRYLWDGALALDGGDPYALAPDAPALAWLRAAWPAPLDHRDVASCYPPLALGAFALAALAGPARALLAWKLLCFVASAATALLAHRALRDNPRAHDAVLVSLAPWLVLEAGVGAHLDALLAPLVLAALLAARRHRWDATALLLGAAAALKLLPGAALLVLGWAAPRRLRFVVLAALPGALSLAGALALGMTPPGSLARVAATWEFGAPLYTLLYAALPFLPEVVRTALSLGGLAGAMVAALGGGDVGRRMVDALGVQLLVSPVLYPWYGLSVAGVGPVVGARWPVWLLAALPLSYEVIDGYQAAGRWSPALWPVLAVALAWAVGLAHDFCDDPTPQDAPGSKPVNRLTNPSSPRSRIA